LSSYSTVDEVNQFFRNTLKQNRTGFKLDVLVSSSADGLRTGHFVNGSVSGNLDVERVSRSGSSSLYSDSCGDMSDQFNNINISDSSNHGLIKQNGHNSIAMNVDRKGVSRQLLDSDAMSYVRSGSTAGETCALPSERHHCAPHLFYHSKNGCKKVGVSVDTNLSNHGMPTKWVSGRSHHYFEDAKYSDGFSGSSPHYLGTMLTLLLT
jgi:hypothetical protein